MHHVSELRSETLGQALKRCTVNLHIKQCQVEDTLDVATAEITLTVAL